MVCDIDLSILGSPWERYEAYAEAIFAESRMRMEEFGPLRVKFLEGMLARAHVFHTAAFRAQMESAARENMAREQRDQATRCGKPR